MNLVPEFDPLFFSEAALRMRAYRQQILASNMANVDTPGYKARDVLFSQALREQLEGRLIRMHFRSQHLTKGITGLVARCLERLLCYTECRCNLHLMAIRSMLKQSVLTLRTTQFAQRLL